MAIDTRKTIVYQKDIFAWIKSVQKKHGFNFSQTVNFILRSAMDDDNQQKGKTNV